MIDELYIVINQIFMDDFLRNNIFDFILLMIVVALTFWLRSRYPALMKGTDGRPNSC